MRLLSFIKIRFHDYELAVNWLISFLTARTQGAQRRKRGLVFFYRKGARGAKEKTRISFF